MILLAFRARLRAAELVDLRWDQVDFQTGVLHVRRAKAGTPATHPLTGRELRALRRLQRETGPSTHLFMSERKAPISTDGFQKMVERLSARAKLGFPVHAHMLRHACGFKMANDGVDTRTIPVQGLVAGLTLEGLAIRSSWTAMDSVPMLLQAGTLIRHVVDEPEKVHSSGPTIKAGHREIGMPP